MAKEVILTGLRSNAEFHLGNFLGAILPMVEMQKKHAGEYQLNMFIPDLHSFTTPIDHGTLYDQTLKNLKVFVAAGLDIDQPDTFIYRQSYIPAHSELTWILSCFSYYGELVRMNQFRDKAMTIKTIRRLKKSSGSTDGLSFGNEMIAAAQGKGVEYDEENLEEIVNNATAGLLIYPVLMATDILLYSADWVPVGDDQRQHIEFTRNIAERMNNRFGKVLHPPKKWDEQVKFIGLDKGVRIRSLKSPDKKMSKSVEDPAGTIMLTDKPDEAAKKIMSATTDSLGNIKFDWENQPGITNLLQIMALVSESSQSDVNSQWENQNSYGELKKATAEAVKKFLETIQASLAKVDEAKLMKKLEQDEIAMSKIASDTLLKVQKAVGLRPKS